MTQNLSEKALNKIFLDAKFERSVFKMQDLPQKNWREVAFMGRSNVGKSSLINAILQNRRICHSSNTPGRTQSLNFININNKFYMVDLPGYGYAKTSKQTVASWNKLTLEYCTSRPNLRRLFLLIDARRSIGQKDKDIMTILDDYAISYQLIITKTDKISRNELIKVVDLIQSIALSYNSVHPQILSTSSHSLIGIPEMRYNIAEIATR